MWVLHSLPTLQGGGACSPCGSSSSRASKDLPPSVLTLYPGTGQPGAASWNAHAFSFFCVKDEPASLSVPDHEWQPSTAPALPFWNVPVLVLVTFAVVFTLPLLRCIQDEFPDPSANLWGL